MSSSPTAAQPTADDWVELYNPTAASVSLANWYLSDDVAEPKKYKLPAVSVPSGGYVRFDNLQGFGLSSNGEDLLLSYLPGTAQDRIVDAISFKARKQESRSAAIPMAEPTGSA